MSLMRYTSCHYLDIFTKFKCYSWRLKQSNEILITLTSPVRHSSGLGFGVAYDTGSCVEDSLKLVCYLFHSGF